jgi:predicted nucleic acid-binding protein
MSIIVNTTVLSNFAAIESIGMLHELHGELFIATEVYEEIRDGLEEGYAFYGDVVRHIYPMAPDGWLRLTSLVDDEEFGLFASMPSRLHQGEAASLAIAQRRDWVLLTDDQAARRWAIEQGVRLSGTVGCLVLGVERGLWSVARGNGCLSRMVQAGFFAPVPDITVLLVS